MTDYFAALRDRIVDLEDRSRRASGSSFEIVHLYLSRHGFRISGTVFKFGDDAYHATPLEAIAAFEKNLAAFEDRDGNLARTLGVEVA